MRNRYNLFIKNILVVLLILFLIVSDIFASGIKFERMSVDEGLSHSSVFSILQDSKGFMWFGTQNGLNKYDGYDFTVFKNDPGDDNSISHNTVFTLFEDSKGNIWIGTLGGGLNLYDHKSQNFSHFKHNPKNPESISNNNVRTIIEDHEGNLWIGTDNGLNLYDSETQTFRKFYNIPNDEKSISNNNIWALHQDASGIIWIGTYLGLNKLDYINGKAVFERFITDNQTNSISHNYVWSILEGKNGNLWLGTDNGLNQFNKSTKTFKHFTKEDGLSHNKIWKIFKDNNDQIWIGTLGGGLNKLVNESDKTQFKYYKNNLNNEYSLSHNFVWSIFQDRSGVLWIGTDVGLNKYDPTRFKFDLIRNIPYKKNSLSSSEVTSIFEDSFSRLWIGTRNGLNKYDPTTDNYLHYTITDNTNKISDNFIRTIYEAPSEKGILWVGTNNGLNRINLRTKGLRIFTEDYKNIHSISSNNITDIFEDSDGNLWIGTLGGLNRFDRKTNKFEVFLHNDSLANSISNNYVFAIDEDSLGNLWIATSFGLNKFDKETNSFNRFLVNKDNYKQGINNNFISDIHFDKKGILWIGTNSGLTKYELHEQKFTNFTENEGLNSNAVVGIEEDKSGYIWLSTNSGISKFNPVDQSFQHYSVGDGLQSNQFTGGANYRSSDGKIFFGGINGLNSFYPKSIRNNSHKPQVVLTDFLLHNNKVEISADSPLKSSIYTTSEIDLPYTDNNFSFSFSALHYSFPGENKYKYRMTGVDKNWINTGTRRFANYTNIDPGEYTFTVVGSNNDGLWNNKGTSIKISISPPFWMTWWFILLSTTAFFGIIYSYFHIRTNNLLALERLRLEIAEDLHDDIGTRLTEISMLSDVVYHSSSSCDSPDRKTIKNIGTIARQLIDNMSDIVWLINPQRDSLYELFLKLKDNYEELLSHSNIFLYINDFNFLKGIRLPMEKRKNIYLIFKEAINNSIKYSKCSEISINTQLKGRTLEITLYDNGKGFDLSKDSSGNGILNMQHRAEIIEGDLRIQSSEENGTMIQFKGEV